MLFQDIANALKQGIRGSDYSISIGEIFSLADLIGVSLPMDKITPKMVLCKSASQPADEINPVQVDIKGHTLKLVGKRNYNDVTLGFYHDPEMILKTFFHVWNKACSDYDKDGNVILRGVTSTIKLIQYDTLHNPVCGYILYDAWCPSVTGIDNDAGSSDAVSEFQVTLAYSKFQFIPLAGVKDLMKNMNSFFKNISNAKI